VGSVKSLTCFWIGPRVVSFTALAGFEQFGWRHVLYEEIDLRPYVVALFRNWMWIVGAGVVGAVVAFGLSTLLPATYEATALVALTETRPTAWFLEVEQFDPRYNPGSHDQPLQAYQDLAASDEILRRLLDEVGSDLPELSTVQRLRPLLEVEPGEHPSLLRLIVRHGDPEVAAEVANSWASLFVSWAGDIYSESGEDQLAFFETQMGQAEERLEAAEAELIAFQARNRSAIFENQLESLGEAQRDYLDEQQSIRFLLQDIRDLRNQLAEASENGVVSFADELTALSLQLQAYDAQTNAQLQFQVSAAESLTGKSRQEQVRYLDGLSITLGARIEEIEGELSQLEPEILRLQEEIAAGNREERRLQRQLSVADETYVALAKRVGQERISIEDNRGQVRLASRAAVPLRPAGPGLIINTTVGGILGALVAVAVVVVIKWWREEGGSVGAENVEEGTPVFKSQAASEQPESSPTA